MNKYVLICIYKIRYNTVISFVARDYCKPLKYHSEVALRSGWEYGSKSESVALKPCYKAQMIQMTFGI